MDNTVRINASIRARMRPRDMFGPVPDKPFLPTPAANAYNAICSRVREIRLRMQTSTNNDLKASYQAEIAGLTYSAQSILLAYGQDIRILPANIEGNGKDQSGVRNYVRV